MTVKVECWDRWGSTCGGPREAWGTCGEPSTGEVKEIFIHNSKGVYWVLKTLHWGGGESIKCVSDTKTTKREPYVEQ